MKLKFSKIHIVCGAALLAVVTFYLYNCQYTSRVTPDDEVQIVIDWNRLILDAEVNTEGYRGPVAARTYAYIGLAAYEAAIPGMDGYLSLSGTYPSLFLPPLPDKKYYHLETVLNATYHSMLQYFFMSSPETVKSRIKNLKIAWDESLMKNIDSVSFKISNEYGRAVAHAVYKWSATDTFGHEANHHNYDRRYRPPVGDGKWVTSKYFPMPPLLPYWGAVRTFVIHTDDYLAKPVPEFSNQPNQFHAQALEVLTLSSSMSAENKWISDFWNDDRPGLTFSPAGHWLSITNQVVERERPSIETALESYLKIGFALSDAIVACWKSKYHYNLIRPETYIQQQLSKDWRPYSPTPSFPSYPSGHSMMGAAAARVLTDIYGENYKMIDYSHKDLRDFSTKPRHFKSFDEMAEENALSRIIMGVHYRIDCEEGMRLGNLVGNEILQLDLQQPME